VYFALLTASSNEQLINEVILSFNVAYIPWIFYSVIQIKKSSTYTVFGNTYTH
jgi:hypothetical protein